MGLKPPMLFAKCQAFHLRRAFKLQQRTCPRCHNVATQCMGSVESNDMEFLGAFNFATIGDVYGFGPCLSRLQSPLDVPKGLLAHQLSWMGSQQLFGFVHGSLVRRCLALVWRKKKTSHIQGILCASSFRLVLQKCTHPSFPPRVCKDCVRVSQKHKILPFDLYGWFWHG